MFPLIRWDSWSSEDPVKNSHNSGDPYSEGSVNAPYRFLFLIFIALLLAYGNNSSQNLVDTCDNSDPYCWNSTQLLWSSSRIMMYADDPWSIVEPHPILKVHRMVNNPGFQLIWKIVHHHPRTSWSVLGLTFNIGQDCRNPVKCVWQVIISIKCRGSDCSWLLIHRTT